MAARTFMLLRRLAVPAAATTAFVVALQLLLGVTRSAAIPLPTQVGGALGSLVTHAQFWSDLALTVENWAAGLLLATAVAVPAGLLIGGSRIVLESTQSLIEFLRPIPVVTLLPLGILLFAGRTLPILMAAAAAFWPILVHAIHGVKEVDPVMMASAQTCHLSPLKRILVVVVPSAIPFVFTGVRISCAIALAVVVAVEMVVGGGGLGSALVVEQNAGQNSAMYSYVLVAGALGLCLVYGVAALERRVLVWHPSVREVD